MLDKARWTGVELPDIIRCGCRPVRPRKATVVLQLASSWLVKPLTVWLTYSLTGRAVSRQRRGAGGRSMRITRVATEPLRVEWRHSADDIPTELWDQCFRAPLEGRWLYATLEQSGLEDQFTFAYALVMREQSI